MSSQFGGSSVEVQAIASAQNHIRNGNDQNIKGFNNLIKDIMNGPNMSIENLKKLYAGLKGVKLIGFSLLQHCLVLGLNMSCMKNSLMLVQF